jgi:thioredoxin reductase (NADPH)
MSAKCIKQPHNNHENLIIVGAGPAGLTAAMYAARGGLCPLIFEGSQPGGQLITTAHLENWPGETDIMGVELVLKMRHHAELFGARFIDQNITQIDFTKKPFIVSTDKDIKYQSDALIIATGASPKHLECKGEEFYWGKGVSCCSVCDGPLYKNKRVLVIGAGNRGLQQALFLSTFTPHVTIIDIQDHLSASHALQERILEQNSTKIIYSSTVTEIKGDGNTVTQAVITNTKTGKQHIISVDGIFLAIGSHPNTDLCKNYLELDESGYIVLKNNSHTSVFGVFAAGDATHHDHRQAIISAAGGCIAALDVQQHLQQIIDKR